MDEILIIDDNKEIRQGYRKLFEKSGFDVLEAKDALSVAEILMAKKNDIGLILLDLQMEEVDGREMYDIIRDYTTKIPVIVCSIFPVSEQKIRIPRARDYFNKADGEKVLLEKVQGVLARF